MTRRCIYPDVQTKSGFFSGSGLQKSYPGSHQQQLPCEFSFPTPWSGCQHWVGKRPEARSVRHSSKFTIKNHKYSDSQPITDFAKPAGEVIVTRGRNVRGMFMLQTRGAMSDVFMVCTYPYPQYPLGNYSKSALLLSVLWPSLGIARGSN